LQPEEIAMNKTMLALPVLATLALAGCASDGGNNQYAQADCKVYPITTASATGVRTPKADSLDQRAAEADLANSGYRFRSLARNGPAYNNMEDVIRNCDK
jgi:outer membrane murein-binding lipoprotein Lpp